MLRVLLLGLLIVCMVMPITKVSAAEPSAKELLNVALNEMKSYESISYCQDLVRNWSNERTPRYRYIAGASSYNCDYSIQLDNNQSERGWLDYCVAGACYRKAYNGSWKKYDDTDSFSSVKTDIESSLSNYKKATISAPTKKNYTVKITPKDKNAFWKKAYVTISKKTGRVSKIKYTLAKKTYTYYNSTSTYTITGGSNTIYNISYGESVISLPDELQ